VIVLKKLTNIIIVISVLLLIYYLYIHISPLDIKKIVLGIIGFVLILAPIICEKFKCIKIEKYIKLIYYFFLLVAFILGVLFQLYYNTAYFDLFIHGLFGFLLSIILGSKIKIIAFRDVVKLISIVIFIGFVWESIEFFSDVFLKTDHQERISGSYDTMTDLLISIAGSIIYITHLKIMNKIKKQIT